MVKHPVGSHLMEKIISILPEVLFQFLLENYFKGKLSELSCHPQANFVVTHLLKSMTAPCQLECIVEELCGDHDFFPNPHDGSKNLLERLVKKQRHGLLVQIVKDSVRFQVGMEAIMNCLIKGFGCHVPEAQLELIPCLLSMETWTRRQHRTLEAPLPSLHGSLLLSSLFLYPEVLSRPLFDSYFSLKNQMIVDWCFHPIASHAVEGILVSPTLPPGLKKKVIHGFKGEFISMGKDKMGGHVLDKIWEAVDLSGKELVAKELVTGWSELCNSFYGKFMVRNFHLEEFKQSPMEWRRKLMSLERKKVMFQEFDSLPSTPTSLNANFLAENKKIKVKKVKKAKEANEIDLLFAKNKVGSFFP